MQKVISRNKQGRRNYHIEDKWEAGLVLMGSEVKSLRAGNCSLDEGYCAVRNGEIWLVNCNIPVYKFAHRTGHEPKRERKLLLHAREIRKISIKAVERGYTIIPLQIYFKGARVKVEIGIGRGKRQHDKRQDVAKRETDREIARALKQNR
jgi:SsrA-binding protein